MKKEVKKKKKKRRMVGEREEVRAVLMHTATRA